MIILLSDSNVLKSIYFSYYDNKRDTFILDLLKNIFSLPFLWLCNKKLLLNLGITVISNSF